MLAQDQRREKPLSHVKVGLHNTALEAPSLLEGAGIEIGQERHPPSAFLLLWSRGEGEDHTLPALRVCNVEHEGPRGPVHLCPGGEDSPAHSAHLSWGRSRGVQSPHCLRVGCCAPRVGWRGRRQVAEVSIDGAVTREPLASHHNYRPRGKN